MSARDRARIRQVEEWQAPGAQAEWVANGGAPKSMLQREERRELLIKNLSEDLISEAYKAQDFFSQRSEPEDTRAELSLQKLSAGVSGITALLDNPLKVKERLPKLQALLTEALEELTALGIWTRSPNSSKLSE